MKKLISLFLALTLLIGCMAVFSGCGKEEGDEGADILVYLSDIVYDLDPTDYIVDDNEAKLLNLLYEPLFTLNARGKLKMAAAKNYRVNRKDRTITINLRESYWSDGTAVQAKDFVYAWRERILNPAHANPAAALLYDIENAIDVKNGTKSLYSLGVNAKDIDTLEIKYREGANVDQLLKNLASVATAPVYPDTVSKIPDFWSKMIDNSMTNGPFALKIYKIEHDEKDTSLITGAQFSLTRNIGYHQNPESKRIDKHVTPSTLVTFWEGTGSVELKYSEIEEKTMFFMGSAMAEERAEYKKKATVKDMLSTYCYAFNTTNEMFADEHIRCALSLALDREAMQEAVTFGKAAEGFFPGTEGLISTDADLSAAQAELAKSSVTKRDFTLTVNNDEDSLLLADLAKAAWEELGFTVTVNAVTYNLEHVLVDVSNNEDAYIKDSTVQALIKDAAVGEYGFDVIGLDWQMYSYDKFVSLCAFTSDMNGNGRDAHADACRTSITGWTSEAYDKLLKDAYAKTDDAKGRAAILDDAEKALVEACPVVPVLYNQNYAFIGNKLKKVSANGFGYFNFTKAKLKGYTEYRVDDILASKEEAAD